ncbi:MAG: hypothetical protein ACF8XB_15690, partial [Planctomycetota bacterium JB042]
MPTRRPPILRRPARHLAPVAAALLLAPAALAAGTKVHWRVECRPDVAPPRLEVTLTASGLDAGAREVALELDDWGEWTEVDAYHLSGVEGRPATRHDPERPTRFVVDVAGGFDGALKVTYAIGMTRVGSKAYERRGLLPALDPDARYVLAYSANTLMRVVEPARDVDDEARRPL